MNVKYYYDESTQNLIRKWNMYLREYDAAFRANYDGPDSEYIQELLSDYDRVMITSQITKIYEAAIPERIQINDV